MRELELKYGCNPNQKPAKVYMRNGGELPFSVLNGKPGYINLLDAFNAYQLVKELKAATGEVCAASFKHVSPAGVALGYELSEVERKMYFVSPEMKVTPQAAAYIRARGSDRLSSFGDFIALSDCCDEVTARYIKSEVSDGIIAPSYSPEALEILRSKKQGKYCVIKVDAEYKATEIEEKDVFGVTFSQRHNDFVLNRELLQHIVTKNRELPDKYALDMLVAMITLKYTQSNSVCFVKAGQAIGIGAGQQSRIHCTRLAGSKADNWFLRQHPKVLALMFKDECKRPERDNAIDLYISAESQELFVNDAWKSIFAEKPEVLTSEEKKAWILQNQNLVLGSDAFFPFGDNVERAKRSGVKYIVEPGGSIRDDNVIAVADRYNMVMVFTGMRLFHH